ncbi:replication initiation factor domain-containing protein [Methylomonas sp. 2BW1-5-20]|uniref:replication initiation factor domain-containing protein n=1 Tax=Methylomonas sp. 2BW1-5-20 TaxID=3376686 RepID=UPI00404DF6E0
MGIQNWGTVSIGGQRDSVLVTVKGQGLMAAKPGWEMRLYQFLRTIPGAKLTRVDYAADNFASETGMDDYLQLYHAGLFSLRGFPKVRQEGNWIRPDGKGRTLYLGSKESGKLLRIYEKGLQLANGFHELYPDWIRIELELGAKDRVIPLDSLLRPGQYLAGAYPALAKFHHVQKRVETFKNTAKSTVQRSIETTRHQFGKHIWMHSALFGADETIKMLTKGKEQLPKNINFDTHEQLAIDEFIHTETPLVFEAGDIPLNIDTARGK